MLDCAEHIILVSVVYLGRAALLRSDFKRIFNQRQRPSISSGTGIIASRQGRCSCHVSIWVLTSMSMQHQLAILGDLPIWEDSTIFAAGRDATISKPVETQQKRDTETKLHFKRSHFCLYPRVKGLFCKYDFDAIDNINTRIPLLTLGSCY